MSVKIMGLVWDSGLPRGEKYVLLAYADHADHDGRNIYPSYGRIAWKTGYDERQVIRITRELEQKGILVKQGFGPNGTNLWSINIERLPARADYGEQGAKKRPVGDDITPPPGDTLSPQSSDTMSPPVTVHHPRGDILTAGGDISGEKSEKMSPESSFNRPLKPSLNHPGNSGEIDILIPGSKVTPSSAWKSVADQLRREVPRSAYEKYLSDLEIAGFDPAHSTFIVWAPNEYARDWVNGRMASVIKRYLTGICNRLVDIQFIAPTAGD